MRIEPVPRPVVRRRMNWPAVQGLLMLVIGTAFAVSSSKDGFVGFLVAPGVWLVFGAGWRMRGSLRELDGRRPHA